MPTAKARNYSEAGKGHVRRLARISREEEARRWAALDVYCPKCGGRVMRAATGAQHCWRCGHKWKLARKEA
jgi:ribosomal protein S27AE